MAIDKHNVDSDAVNATSMLTITTTMTMNNNNSNDGREGSQKKSGSELSKYHSSVGTRSYDGVSQAAR